MFRFLAKVSLALSLLATTGCTTAAVAVLDEKVSQMMEQDCTTVNIMLGESYCKDKRNEIKQEPVYCYRTLGGVDCYAQKGPYKTESPRVRDVSELGSNGATVEFVSQKSDSKPLFLSRKLDTAEVD